MNKEFINLIIYIEFKSIIFFIKKNWDIQKINKNIIIKL